jgi:hypothetical protein
LNFEVAARYGKKRKKGRVKKRDVDKEHTRRKKEKAQRLF